MEEVIFPRVNLKAKDLTGDIQTDTIKGKIVTHIEFEDKVQFEYPRDDINIPSIAIVRGRGVNEFNLEFVNDEEEVELSVTVTKEMLKLMVMAITKYEEEENARKN